MSLYTKHGHKYITGKIIGAAIEVHRILGPGVLERVYEVCLVKELTDRGIKAEAQKALPLTYKGTVLDESFRVDILVEDEVIIELKAVDSLQPVHRTQILSYMRLANKHIGLLINFHVDLLKNGVERFTL